jgi:hypothetical protein
MSWSGAGMPGMRVSSDGFACGLIGIEWHAQPGAQGSIVTTARGLDSCAMLMCRKKRSKAKSLVLLFGSAVSDGQTRM